MKRNFINYFSYYILVLWHWLVVLLLDLSPKILFKMYSKNIGYKKRNYKFTRYLPFYTDVRKMNALTHLKHQDVAHNYELEIRLAEERIAFQREYSDENETLDELLEKDLKALFCQALDHLSPNVVKLLSSLFFVE